MSDVNGSNGVRQGCSILRPARVLLACALVALGGGCASKLPSDAIANETFLKSDTIEIALGKDATDSPPLTIQFLGVGGFSLEAPDRKIITAPSYSNPSLWRMLPGVTIEPNKKYIDEAFPHSLRSNGAVGPPSVEAVLVGHSHYDHLLDVPRLLDMHIPGAKVYGSETMSAILNVKGYPCGGPGDPDAVAVHLRDQVDKEWVELGEEGDRRFRILPMTSSHAPHLLGRTFQKGKRECGDTFTVRTAWDWEMGEVYAYLIDYVDTRTDAILYRIFYQDSAGTVALDKQCGGDGQASCETFCAQDHGDTRYLQCEIQERWVDIALVTLAGADKEPGTGRQAPRALVETLQADLYIVGHWEDFFGSHGKEPRVARGSDARAYIDNLDASISQGAQWVLPLPGESISINTPVQ